MTENEEPPKNEETTEKLFKNNKSPGENEITEMLRAGREQLEEYFHMTVQKVWQEEVLSKR